MNEGRGIRHMSGCTRGESPPGRSAQITSRDIKEIVENFVFNTLTFIVFGHDNCQDVGHLHVTMTSQAGGGGTA
jgi:hypothetical protein